MSDKRRKAAAAAKIAKDDMACNNPRRTPPNHMSLKPVKGEKKRSFALASKVSRAAPARKASQRRIAKEGKALRRDMLKTLKKEKCLLPTGLTE
jgi:hypothetical protein